MKSVFHTQMQMLARHVVTLDPVTTAVLNQLLVQESTIKVVSSLQLLIKKLKHAHLSLGMRNGVSLLIRLHVMQGSAMAINIAMCHSVCCEQTGRDREKSDICNMKYDTVSQE